MSTNKCQSPRIRRIVMGGTAKLIRATPAERALATGVAKVMGLDLAGVDLVRSAHGPVLEVNSSLGFEEIETATSKDVVGAIIEYIHKDSKQGPNKQTGKG